MFYEPEKNEQFWEWDALFSLSPSLLPQKARRSTICIFIFLRLLATTPTFWWTISGFFATNLACYLNSIKMENSKIFTSFVTLEREGKERMKSLLGETKLSFLFRLAGLLNVHFRRELVVRICRQSEAFIDWNFFTNSSIKFTNWFSFSSWETRLL